MVYTKGYMIKKLKERGYRKGIQDNTGALVQLEHLKYYQIAKLYNEVFE